MQKLNEVLTLLEPLNGKKLTLDFVINYLQNNESLFSQPQSYFLSQAMQAIKAKLLFGKETLLIHTDYMAAKQIYLHLTASDLT